jgi:hypothetical protein
VVTVFAEIGCTAIAKPAVRLLTAINSRRVSFDIAFDIDIDVIRGGTGF